MKKRARIVPVFKEGKEHAGHADGFIVHPDDRGARRLPNPKAKLTEEEPTPAPTGDADGK